MEYWVERGFIWRNLEISGALSKHVSITSKILKHSKNVNSTCIFCIQARSSFFRILKIKSRYHFIARSHCLLDFFCLSRQRMSQCCSSLIGCVPRNFRRLILGVKSCCSLAITVAPTASSSTTPR